MNKNGPIFDIIENLITILESIDQRIRPIAPGNSSLLIDSLRDKVNQFKIALAETEGK